MINSITQSQSLTKQPGLTSVFPLDQKRSCKNEFYGSFWINGHCIYFNSYINEFCLVCAEHTDTYENLFDAIEDARKDSRVTNYCKACDSRRNLFVSPSSINQDTGICFNCEK